MGGTETINIQGFTLLNRDMVRDITREKEAMLFRGRLVPDI